MPERKESNRRILDRISDGVIALDNDWKIEYINDNAARRLHKSKDEVIGKKFFEVFPETEKTSFAEKYKYAMENQETVSLEDYYPPRDAWYHSSAYPSETGLSIYFKDITPKKQAEQQYKLVATRQERIRDLQRMVIEEEDVVDILLEASKIVVRGLEIEYAGVLKLEDDRSTLINAACYGTDFIGIGEKVAEVEDSYYIKKLFREKEPVYVRDYEKQNKGERPEIVECLEIKSGIGALIGKYSDPWGAISATGRVSKNFNEEDREFVQSVANVLALAIREQENADSDF